MSKQQQTPEQFSERMKKEGPLESSKVVKEEQTEKETRTKEPVVKEEIKVKEKVEVQPVVEREREKLKVEEVVKPMRQKEVHAKEVLEKNLPTTERGEFKESDESFKREQERLANQFQSSVTVGPTETEREVKEAEIKEKVKHHVVEEVQPVIYKEVEQPRLVKKTLPVHEKVVEAPVIEQKILETEDLGTQYKEDVRSKEEIERLSSKTASSKST